MENTSDGDRPVSDATSAFPTFLDTDPYPSRGPDGRPTSSGSAKTDTTSEFGGEEYASARERQSTIPSTTGPVGEPGLPPARPMNDNGSLPTSQRGMSRATQAPPPSRRGLAAFTARSGGKLRNHATTEGDYSGSAPGTSVRRTHVPSLTAGQGFFRPMSSQRLQAQREQLPATSLADPLQPRAIAGARPSTDSERQRRHRYSNASVNTLRDRPNLRRDEEVPPLPVSRGTAFTSDGTTLRQADGHGAASVASNNSAAALHERQSGLQQLNMDTNGFTMSNRSSSNGPKSPRSLRASLGLNSRRASSRQDRPSPGLGHEKLHSDPSSPVDAFEKPPLPRGTGAPPSLPPAHGGSGKNYEYFAGNLLFFCSGRLLNSKARPLNVATFLLTTLPTALFFGFSAPWLWHHVSPAMPILFAYVFYITISAFLHAAFSDPGVLPRNLHPHPPNSEEERDPLTVGPPTTEWVMVKTFPSSRNSSSGQTSSEEAGRQGQTTAMEVPTKYCKSCNIWRPPRAHHCRVCDACIETQDHHCVWLNNCVGRRNYRFFFAYVGFASVLALMLIAFSITHIAVYARGNGISFGQALTGRTQERVAFAMFIFSILALPYPGSLTAYHLFLIARGETTREYLNSHKFLPKDRHRPFSQSSFCRNWVAVLARPRPPTYMQFRASYTEGDMRFGHTQPKKVRKTEWKGRYSTGGGAESKGQEKNEGVEMKRLSALGRLKGKGDRDGRPGFSGPVNNTHR